MGVLHHEVHLKLVMELLKKEKLFANFSKREFWLQEVCFFGHIVNSNGIHVDPSKIEAMKNWKIPKTPSEIRSFLGLAGYYRRFIANFSKIAKPLTSLTQKNQKYEYGKEQEEAFQTLKENFCYAPILGKKELNMRQKRWIELFSDYDCEICYHPGKADVVADALSRKERVKPRRVRAISMTIQSSVKDRILAAQGDVRKMIMDEAHATRLNINVGIKRLRDDLEVTAAKVARLLAISTPPSSPLSPWSLPLPQIPSSPLPPIRSPSLPLSPPSPVLSPAPPPSPIRSLGYRAAMIRLRAEAASTSYSQPLPPPFILSPTRSDAPSSGIPPPLPISVPTSSPPLLLPSAIRRENRPEVTLPPRKRLGIALSPRYEVGESSSAVAARPARGLRANYGFVATMDREIRRDPQDTDEIYMRLDDEQSQRQLLAGRLNMCLETDEHMRQAVTLEMLKTDHRRSAEMRELRTTNPLQGQVTALQGQQGPAGGPAQPELPEVAGSSS
ncbi:hypothetical protein Tco_0154044 [Tanacetum coccineum]